MQGSYATVSFRRSLLSIPRDEVLDKTESDNTV